MSGLLSKMTREYFKVSTAGNGIKRRLIYLHDQAISGQLIPQRGNNGGYQPKYSNHATVGYNLSKESERIMLEKLCADKLKQGIDFILVRNQVGEVSVYQTPSRANSLTFGRNLTKSLVDCKHIAHR